MLRAAAKDESPPCAWAGLLSLLRLQSKDRREFLNDADPCIAVEGGPIHS